MANEDKLQEILAASLKCFSRYGYKKTTMEEIAAEMGLTKGALYLYADSKKELYQQAVAAALSRWQNRVREAIANENSPHEKMKVMSFKAFQYLAEDDELRRVLVNDPDIFPMFPVEDPFLAINENSRDMLRSILEDGINAGVFRPVDPESITWLLFSIYKLFIIDTYIVSEKETTNKLFSEAVDLILHGLLR